MVSSFDAIAKIRSYLSEERNEASVDSFREWVVRAQLAPADPAAARLLADIEARFFEFSQKAVSEEQWRKRLVALISPAPQSAESFLLNYFYVVPSVQLDPPNQSFESQVENWQNLSNYKPQSECDAVAA